MISMFEHLFNSGVMKIDPGRKVGVFDLEVISKFPALRKAEMENIRWMDGEWIAENSVRATRVSPAYVDNYHMCIDSARTVPRCGSCAAPKKFPTSLTTRSARSGCY